MERIKIILLDLAEYYSIKLSDKQVQMYVEDLVEMGSEAVFDAVRKYRVSWSAAAFPLPSRIRKEACFYQPSLTRETCLQGMNG